MKPIVIKHNDYQDFVMEQLRKHYSSGILTLVQKDWNTISKLWLTDLSATTLTISNTYSLKGPAPRDPASMLRSYLLHLSTHPNLGITEWVDMLHRVPLYAIMSGFKPGDVPGVGTFYDFFSRFWELKDKNVKPHLKHKILKKKKSNLKKGEKQPPKNPGIVDRLVKRYLRDGANKKLLPGDCLFDFFQSQFLAVSAGLGLIGDINAVGIAGDGTPIVTARYSRNKRTCDCRAQGIANCNHLRYYSQPDCNSGRDSYRECYFHGYHLYMLSASDSQYDLPLYPRLQPASRHDAVSAVVSTIEFSQRCTLGKPGKMLLDAAHDAEPIYILLNSFNVEPFIDLQSRSKKNYCSEGDIKISNEGIPICPANLKMEQNGFEISRKRKKWKCPLANRKGNTCKTPCSTAKYGRTFHTFLKDNPRFFTKTPRDSDAWKLVYKRRTSIERSNKREKVDYQLEAGRHRSTQMWYIRTYAIMMCQHIDAWHRHLKGALSLKNTIFPAVPA